MRITVAAGRAAGGIAAANFTVGLTFVDPCSLPFALADSPFFDQEYTLGTAALPAQEWQAADLIAPAASPVDCGPISVEIYVDDGLMTQPRVDLFTDDRSGDPAANAFTTNYSEDASTAGVYNFKYRVTYVNENLSAESEVPFSITVVDPCTAPTSLDLVPLED